MSNRDNFDAAQRRYDQQEHPDYWREEPPEPEPPEYRISYQCPNGELAWTVIENLELDTLQRILRIGPIVSIEIHEPGCYMPRTDDPYDYDPVID